MRHAWTQKLLLSGPTVCSLYCDLVILCRNEANGSHIFMDHLRNIVEEFLTVSDIDQKNLGSEAKALIGGECIFIYSCYARLISFEINLISKESSRA